MTNILKELNSISPKGKFILWANLRLQREEYENPIKIFLPKNYSCEQLQGFFAECSKYHYDSGFGGQELFGYVVFIDGTWLEREEYDGSERWVHKETPKYPTDEESNSSERERIDTICPF